MSASIETANDGQGLGQPTSGPAKAEDHRYDAWLEGMLAVARHYRVDCSAESVRVAIAWARDMPLEPVLRHMARQMGLNLRVDKFDPTMLTPWRLPLLVELSDGQVAMLETIGSDGQVSARLSGERGLQTSIDAAALEAGVVRVVSLRPAHSVPDARVDDYIKPYEENWFRQIVLRDWRRYTDVMVASLGANLLALSTMLFSMQVYDRVIPSQSMPTLYVLFGGVMLAVVFEFALRLMRVRITDLLGKRADLRVSDLVFGHALRVRNEARPKSTGAFIAQIRELEQVRELITSTTITAMADLPFFLLFLVVLWFMAGPLVLVPVGGVLLLLIPGLLAQRHLARLSNEGMREASLRNSMLVETVQGIEDIKLLRAEHRFQGQWNHLNEVSADIGLRQRFATGMLVTWTQEIQSTVFAVTVLFGAVRVMDGDMTTGSLVAASILASRMMAPISQLAGVLSRWQQAKVALSGLNALMKLPVDHPERSKRVHRPVIQGSFEINQASFQYGEADKQAALQVAKLTIKPGERIAILGRNGAGKSTLLQVLAGMHAPQQGEVLLDGLRLSLIDPADVRRDIGLLTQNARLFYGSLRDNLTLGAPDASDDDILAALELSGVSSFVEGLPEGLDHVVLEGGRGLSGGQRQALLLARMLIRQPQVVLLDEPTASLDEVSERQVLERLGPWLQGKTLIVATHRLAVLSLVERVVVLDGGRVVLDDAKAKAIARMAAARS